MTFRTITLLDSAYAGRFLNISDSFLFDFGTDPNPDYWDPDLDIGRDRVF